MAITLVGTGTAVNTLSGLTLAITKPSGVQYGDLILISCFAGATPQTWTDTPDGFTALAASSTTTWSQQLLYKWATGAEGATFTVTATSSHITAAIVAVYRGVGAFDPAPAAGAGALTTANITAPSITPIHTGDTLVWFGATSQASATGAPTVSVPSGYTPQVAQANSGPGTSTSYNSVIYGDKANAAAGATGTVVGSSSASEQATGATLVSLQPASPSLVLNAAPGKTWQRHFQHRQTLQQAQAQASVAANVTGVGAAITVAGGVGTFEGDAAITGVGAAVTVSGGTGTFEGNANVTGVGAQVVVAGGVGTPFGSSPNANVTGVGASVTVAGGVGTTAASANVQGVGAQVTVAGGVGTFLGSAGVTGVGAQVSVAGGIGTPSGSGKVTGVGAQITVAAGAGIFSASANVTGVGASVVVAGGIGTPSGSGAANVTGVAASVSVAGGVGTAKGGANVQGVGAAVTVHAGAGTLSASVNITGAGALVTITAGIGIAIGTSAIIVPPSAAGSIAQANALFGSIAQSNTLEGSLEPSNELDGSVEPSNELDGSLTNSNSLGGKWL